MRVSRETVLSNIPLNTQYTCERVRGELGEGVRMATWLSVVQVIIALEPATGRTAVGGDTMEDTGSVCVSVHRHFYLWCV